MLQKGIAASATFLKSVRHPVKPLADTRLGKQSQLTTPWSDPTYIDEVAYGWSPDGQYVVSSSGRYKPGHMAIALVPVVAAPKAETEATMVTTSAEHRLWNTAMSPNGRWICFQAVKGTTSRLALVASTGGDWRWLTDEGFWIDKPRWSVDGRLIYFVSSQGGLFNVWAVAFDTERGAFIGEPFQVTRFDGSGEHLPSATLSLLDLAVGRDTLAMPVIDPTGGIWLLENVRR